MPTRVLAPPASRDPDVARPSTTSRRSKTPPKAGHMPVAATSAMAGWRAMRATEGFLTGAAFSAPR